MPLIVSRTTLSIHPDMGSYISEEPTDLWDFPDVRENPNGKLWLEAVSLCVYPLLPSRH